MKRPWRMREVTVVAIFCPIHRCAAFRPTSSSSVWASRPVSAPGGFDECHRVLCLSFHSISQNRHIRSPRDASSFHNVVYYSSNICHDVPEPSFPTSFDHTIAAMTDCWQATTESVNPHDDNSINDLLRCFNSPAPQAYHALLRALVNSENDDSMEEVLQVFSYLLKAGCRFEMIEAKHGDDSNGRNKPPWRIVSDSSIAYAVCDWERFPNFDPQHDKSPSTVWKRISMDKVFPHTLSVAHEILNLAIERSDFSYKVDTTLQDDEEHLLQERESLENLCERRLHLTLGLDTRGRSAADTAFSLAMAGVCRLELFDLLTHISYHELKRVGSRPSFPSKYILQIVEKLAAAGVGGGKEVSQGIASTVFRLAADLLRTKIDRTHHMEVIESLEAQPGTSRNGKCRTSFFGLHSTRPMLWLWRFSSRQHKAREFQGDGISHSGTFNEALVGREFDSRGWIRNFDDLSLPLVVDVGCGMGVSLLGLATLPDVIWSKSQMDGLPTFGKSNNYLGGDLSHLFVTCARGITKRCGIEKYLQFSHLPAIDLLEGVRSLYPHGKVALIMIQFPTPFKLPSKVEGNSQLPTSDEGGFMVTSELLRLACDILKVSQGLLLLQSNCEDVSVKMRQMAEEAGLQCLSIEPHVKELPGLDRNLPLRTQQWIRMGGERPLGAGWLAEPFLPPKGYTETEVNCKIQGTPVHRCLFRAKFQ